MFGDGLEAARFAAFHREQDLDRKLEFDVDPKFALERDQVRATSQA